MCPREKGNSIILSDSLQGEFCTICQKVIQTKKGPISAFVFYSGREGKICAGGIKNSLLLLPPFFWLNALMSFGVLGTYGKTKRTGVHSLYGLANQTMKQKNCKKKKLQSYPSASAKTFP